MIRKLTSSQVAAIQKSSKPQWVIALDYRISRSSVSKIKSGQMHNPPPYRKRATREQGAAFNAKCEALGVNTESCRNYMYHPPYLDADGAIQKWIDMDAARKAKKKNKGEYSYDWRKARANPHATAFCALPVPENHKAARGFLVGSFPTEEAVRES